MKKETKEKIEIIAYIALAIVVALLIIATVNYITHPYLWNPNGIAYTTGSC